VLPVFRCLLRYLIHVATGVPVFLPLRPPEPGKYERIAIKIVDDPGD
jgi:hypothetical protein